MEIICFNQIIISHVALWLFSYTFHLPVALAGLFVFIYTYVCVCLYTRTDYWKWGLKKPFPMPWRVSVECKRYFETQTHTSFLPQSNWSTGNAAPELIQEFEPGSQNNESVELMSPIATFSLHTQLNIRWSATRGIIYSALCWNYFLSVCLISESEFGKGK